MNSRIPKADMDCLALVPAVVVSTLAWCVLFFPDRRPALTDMGRAQRTEAAGELSPAWRGHRPRTVPL